MATWDQHGDGVYSMRYASLDLNIGAVVCPEGVLLVDTRATRPQARQVVDDLRQITKQPVRWVVNTHHHWDHTFGNCEFPQAAIWGHERCVDALRDFGESMRAQVKQFAPEHAADLDAVDIVIPVHTYTTEITVSFGGRTIELRHPGRGHTDNDTVVIVPDSGVVFAGDLIEESAPPSFSDSYPFEWPEAARAVAGWAGGVVVPGHGAPVDASFVRAQAEHLSEVSALARQHHDAGLTAEQAAAEPGPFPERALLDAYTRAWEQIT